MRHSLKYERKLYEYTVNVINDIKTKIIKATNNNYEIVNNYYQKQDFTFNHNYKDIKETITTNTKTGTICFIKFIKNLSTVIFLLSALGMVCLFKAFGFMGNKSFKLWCLMMDKLGRKRVILDRDGKEPYLERYYILFLDRNKYMPFNIFLHKFIKGDEDELHDHPWSYFTFILAGGYWEHMFVDMKESVNTVRHWRKPGFFQKVPANHTHRVEIDKDKPDCWTLFIPFKQERVWGFWTVENNDNKMDNSKTIPLKPIIKIDKYDANSIGINQETRNIVDKDIIDWHIIDRSIIDKNIIDKNNDNIPRRSMRQREKKRTKLNDKENDVVDTLSVLATIARDNTNRNVIRWIHNENYKKVKDS